MLFQLADNDKLTAGLASALVYDFSKLPPNICEPLAVKLAYRKSLPEDVKNELLAKLEGKGTI